MNRVFATVLTILALTVGMTSKAALVILGALATAFGFVMYVLLVGVIWGFKFPRVGAVLGCSPAWSPCFLPTRSGQTRCPCTVPSGDVQRPGCGGLSAAASV
jgi:hypothetical protein